MQESPFGRGQIPSGRGVWHAPTRAGSTARCHFGTADRSGRGVRRAGLPEAVRGRRRQRWSRRARRRRSRPRARRLRPGQELQPDARGRAHAVRRRPARAPRRRARGRRAPDPRAEGAARDRRRQSESVLRRLPPVHGARRHPRRDGPARCGQPRRRQVRAHRHVDARQAGLGPEGHRGRPQRAGRHAAGDPLLVQQPRPRVDRRRGRAPAHEVGDRAQERPADRRPAGPDRAVVHADPERRRLRLHVHLRRRRRQPPVRAERDAQQSLLAQDAARQRRRRHLRRAVPERPGRRRRPEPELPGQARHRRGGRHQPDRRRDLPRPVRALGAREPRVRPPAAQDRLQGQRQLPLRRPAAAHAGVVHHRLRARSTRRSSTR